MIQNSVKMKGNILRKIQQSLAIGAKQSNACFNKLAAK